MREAPQVTEMPSGYDFDSGAVSQDTHNRFGPVSRQQLSCTVATFDPQTVALYRS